MEIYVKDDVACEVEEKVTVRLLVLKLVLVALVIVARVPVRLPIVPLLAVKILANIFVVVACVVVLRRRFGRKRSVANVSVALMRASARALVKYKLVPSATFVERRPKDEVASC